MAQEHTPATVEVGPEAQVGEPVVVAGPAAQFSSKLPVSPLGQFPRPAVPARPTEAVAPQEVQVVDAELVMSV